MPLKSAGKKPAPQCTVCKVVAILTITFSSDLKIRLRHTLAAVITVLCCSVTGAGAETTEAQRANDLLVQQRALYADAIELIRKGKRQRVTQIRNQLVDYPLYPYLVYADLAANMHYSRKSDISQYLDNYAGSVKAQHLRKRWLDYLARRTYWTTFMAFYDPDEASVKHQCQYQLARYYGDPKDPAQPARRAQALDAALELWNVEQSQPSECDKLFSRLQAENKISQSLVWERFNKALLNHEHQLARYLQRSLTSQRYQALSQLYYEVDRNPASISEFGQSAQNSREELQIIRHGLIHLARKDSHAALKQWSRYQQTHEFSHSDRSDIVTAIIKGLFEQGFAAIADTYFVDHLQLLNDTLDGSLVEWRIRRALEKRDWPAVQLWLKRLPKQRQTSSVWRYWTIRSMQSDPTTTRDPAITELTASLAKERDFYGFLASDMLDREYSLNHNPITINQQQLAAIEAIPAMARARELYFHGDTLDANREWNQASANFNYEEWLASAMVSGKWQWHSKAIASLGRARYWDDIELRFPLAYAADIDKAAQATGIENYLLFALARQESAFESSATSSAGARGLMQVMPATAKSTARKYKIPYRKRSQLLDAKTNIAIASRYYQELLARYSGNRIAATAAYNAGPYRVDQWLKNSDGQLPFDIWIEVIPYRETRSYVRNVLMYSIIYSRKLGAEPPMVLRDETYRLL